MKITHYRFTDTGHTTDLSWQKMGEGVVAAYALEMQKSKNTWKQIVHDGQLSYGYGVRQAINNLRFHVHWNVKNTHGYQIDGVDEVPLIAVPYGYEIVRLFIRGESWRMPDFYLPRHEDGTVFSDNKAIRVFERYQEALAFLRTHAGQQQHAYDVCSITF